MVSRVVTGTGSHQLPNICTMVRLNLAFHQAYGSLRQQKQINFQTAFDPPTLILAQNNIIFWQMVDICILDLHICMVK